LQIRYPSEFAKNANANCGMWDTELCGKSESGILNWQIVHQSSDQEDTNGSGSKRYRNARGKSRAI
jgi:hypothetical protein